MRPDQALSWTWESGVGGSLTEKGLLAGKSGLVVVSLVAGLVSGIAESLGLCFPFAHSMTDNL